MSIASMIDAKLVNEWPDERPATGFERALGLKRLVERPKSEAAQTPQATAVPSTAIGQLARWIPTESLTLYVAFLGVLTPIVGTARACDAGYAGRWAALGAFLVMTVCIVVLVHVAKVRRTQEPFRWPLFEMSVSAVAFTAWAIALPDTPLNDFCGYKTEVGAFIVLATTAIIGLVADALGRNVTAAAEPAAPAAPRPGGAVRAGG
jgi:ABC-type xylose transport system permease subunit